MSKSNPGPYMAEFLRQLAREVENNKSLSRRLSTPFFDYIKTCENKKPSENKRPQQASKNLIPEGFDPFMIYHEKGGVGLLSSLQDMDVSTLKAILAEYGLDPARTYTRWRKHERLSALILERIKAMSNKGRVFQSQ